MLSFNILNNSIVCLLLSYIWDLLIIKIFLTEGIFQMKEIQLNCVGHGILKDIFQNYPSPLFECLGLCSLPCCAPHYPSLYSPQPSVTGFLFFSPLSVLVSLNFLLLYNLGRDADVVVAFSCLAAGQAIFFAPSINSHWTEGIFGCAKCRGPEKRRESWKPVIYPFFPNQLVINS